jgi:hypothetical protein
LGETKEVLLNAKKMLLEANRKVAIKLYRIATPMANSKGLNIIYQYMILTSSVAR